MRLRPAIAVAAAALTAVLGMPPPAALAAGDATTLYVAKSASCSDAGPGSQAVPFCTIGAAAKVVEPGQTVRIAPGSYPEQVDVRRSGLPGHPIRFEAEWAAGWPSRTPRAFVTGPTPEKPLTHAFTLTGVHDVELHGLGLASAEETVTVTDSSAVTLDRLYVHGTVAGWAGGVAVSGTSSDITVSRNQLRIGNGITIGAGVRRAVVTTNDVANSRAGVTVTDAPGTVVTGNTVGESGNSGITLAGTSTDAVVENNVLVRNASAKRPGTAQLVVEPGAVAGTKVDYNLVSDTDAYLWSGTAYGLPALQAATGQAAHDLADPANGSTGMWREIPHVLFEASPPVDSGDPAAPGLPDTDAAGRPVIDHPNAPNSGPQQGFRDRGAYELYGLTDVSVHSDLSQGPYPLTVQAKASARDDWSSNLTYTFDFGDGSAPVTSSEPAVPHTYTAKGRHQISVTARDDYGQTLTTLGDAYGAYGATVDVRDPGPPVAALTASSLNSDFRFEFNAYKSTGPWPITSYVFDYGDGSPAETFGSGGASHLYAAPGTYTASVTVTDSAGRTARSTTTVSPAFAPAGFVPVTPKRIYDTRDPANDPGAPWSRWFRPGDRREIGADLPPGATAAVVNITATGATEPTHLDVYPIGGAPGEPSNVNVAPGETVANLVTVPVTSTGHYNFGVFNRSGAVHVVIDLYGYYVPGAKDRYTALPAARLADTRESGVKPGPGSSLPLQVTGTAGVPATATAVVLNLTATEPTADGYLAARPGGQDGQPSTSSVNFRPGQTVANQVIVPVGPDGIVNIYNNAGSTHVIADVVGYYGADGKGLFTAVLPVRLQDTRVAPLHALGPGGETSVRVGGAGQVPPDAVAGVFNLTATAPLSDGHAIAYPDRAPVPQTSNLNFRAGQTVANHAQIQLGPDGVVRLRNNSSGVDLITDLFGYFTNR